MLKKIKIIAEIAQGYEGSFQQSKLLIKAGANAGADSIKFQMVYADELAIEDYEHYPLFKTLEFTNNQWENLKNYSKKLKIEFIVEIFGQKSLETAQKIGIETIKVHGTDISNLSLLNLIAEKSIPNIILGIGGAYWQEIKTAIKILKQKKLILLCGFQGYPTKNEDNHISRIKCIYQKSIKIHQDITMGFADHPGDEKYKNTISLIAIGAGAKVIEKHLTLGKIMELEDFESAINPDEFKEFVNQIRVGNQALGSAQDVPNFNMSSAEETYRKKIRKDVVANKELIEGSILTINDLELKRTNNPNAIKELDNVLNKTLLKGIKKNSPILNSDIN
jgi:N,N'-diacetyllegionaminate synthase